ncbi:hypothetical protein V4D30_08490 [Thermodesulfovibrio sp. 3907-1M]|uniref:ABC transporter ATP-binding protein n=1 Tax=Thermodesulfovibrio autotrophicus TaxID=3118333 RepID=A0AAU8GVZ3_9BACT
MKPVCYLFDEPSNGLDEKTKERLLQYLTGNAKTYLIVSHDRDFIEKTTDKVYLLEKGSIYS